MLKWTLFQLNQLQHRGLLIDETIDVTEEARSIEKNIRSVRPVHVTGRADLSSKKATFHLKIEGSMILPCSRTLVDVDYPININTTETFLFEPVSYEGENEELHYIEGDVVNLIPIIAESIALEVPLQVYSENPDSSEAAPQSGNGWGVITEEDQSEKIDPRLAGLAKFFDKNKEE